MVCLLLTRYVFCLHYLSVRYCFVFFFKQKTAYEMRISDWSSDVCSSDLFTIIPRHVLGKGFLAPSDQLTKAVIGVGGMGRGHFKYAGTRVVAICDVDKGHIKQALGMLDKGVKTFADYRELITLPEVDIVHIEIGRAHV